MSLNFAFQPPELTSGQVWTGPGSAGLAAAGASWQALCAELGSAAAAYSAVMAALSVDYMGPAAMSMALAAAPYVVWMLATAAQCEVAATGAFEAAAIFEAARAGVVPPPIIAANRSTLATLLATNFLGVNSPAIAANEAEYMGFWTTDATTMFAYSGNAAGVAGSLTPFIPPMPNSNPAGLAGPAANVVETGAEAVTGVPNKLLTAAGGLPGGLDPSMFLSAGPQLIGALPQVFSSLTTPLQSATAPIQSFMGTFQGLLGPLMGAFNNPALSNLTEATAMPAVQAANLTAGGPATGLGANAVTAALGRGLNVGGVSVPAGWATAAPGSTTGPAVVAASSATPAVAPATQAGMSGAPLAPLMAAGHGSGGGGGDNGYGRELTVLPRLA